MSSIAQRAAASLDAIDQVEARVATTVSERDRMIARLRDRGIEVPRTATNFLWVPCGAEPQRYQRQLERRGIIARAIAGAGVRTTVGDRAENDRVIQGLIEVEMTPRDPQEVTEDEPRSSTVISRSSCTTCST